ncbi:Oidioi.mRNA.OKI2018_I69.PAR.g8859.t1.cds [Oikopleura dioica]|uniref:Oidioi.mRNA.OKI2018_I69.PAR.g8859.t1.cds n=1 Tax=Oikopleura dioica TaxID=34765 RepID=A0ABN7RNY2_OIKDI|nr:Oidioi.mRNA.OKI2018_I69.PAR.g8859.t1.cds [Oikopleura dioica]
MNPFFAAGTVILIQTMKSCIVLGHLLKKEDKEECDFYVISLNFCCLISMLLSIPIVSNFGDFRKMMPLATEFTFGVNFLVITSCLQSFSSCFDTEDSLNSVIIPINIDILLIMVSITLIYGLIIVIWYTGQKYKSLQQELSKNSTMWITPSVSSLSKHDQIKNLDGSTGDFAITRNSLAFHAENADRLLKTFESKTEI